MELVLGNNIISSYQRLSYTPWHAFAEFVDNSTQACINNFTVLNNVLQREGKALKVEISYLPNDDRITISDNSIGMSKSELQDALVVGNPPENTEGRSRYGLGMKTAACWFGDIWSVKTKKYGEKQWHRVEINVATIAGGDNNLPYSCGEEDVNEHYTIIEIKSLNRVFQTRTLSKIRDFLRSMYRIDITKRGLHLFWQGEQLTWEDITQNLYVSQDGQPYKKDFNFEVNGKEVAGWVGVLGRGKASRRNAGFSIIQADRVIEGWPKGFKPSLVFGEQEDGRNDLINQRLVGELYLDGFAVSHTKDQIIWHDNDYEEIDKLLKEVCADAMYLASHLRFTKDVEKVEDELVLFRDNAVDTLNTELKSAELVNFLGSAEPPPESILKLSYSKIENAVTEGDDPYLDVEIGGGMPLRVRVFFNDASEFEPYVITELLSEEDVVNVIINSLHPHYQEMKHSDSLLNLVRHCIYDGVAEWKAIKLIGEIQPNTVKFLKDGLLRLPFEIKGNSANSILGSE